MKVAQFKGHAPIPWRGRYKRIPGATTTFHVRMVDGRWWPVVEWLRRGERATCAMVEDSDAGALVEAVNAGKAAFGAPAGGAFAINEFGQVLVPSPAGNHVVLVGEWQGPLEFENAFDGGTFDLGDDDLYEPGDAWDGPYVGIPHNLHKLDEIYFWDEDDTGGIKIPCPSQDPDLVRALRSIRRHGAVRFIVLPGGIVLTKQEIGDDSWDATYVGRLDFDRWFVK